MYDLTIFKLHCGRLTLKIYTKGERVLLGDLLTEAGVLVGMTDPASARSFADRLLDRAGVAP